MVDVIEPDVIEPDVLDAQVVEEEAEGGALAHPVFGPGQARLNVTWARQNGDLPDPVLYETDDGAVRAMAEEAIRNGDIPGITADATVRLADFQVDRFRATDDIPYDRIMIRPKSAYGVGA